VGPIAVIVSSKIRQHSDEMSLIENNDVVQALSPKGPHQSLCDRIGLRRPIRSPDSDHAQSRKSGVEVLPVDVVSVVDQVYGLAIPRRCIDQLLPDPCRTGTGRHHEVDELASDVAHKDQDIQRSEADRLRHQEVGGPDALRLTCQEGPPGLARRAS